MVRAGLPYLEISQDRDGPALRGDGSSSPTKRVIPTWKWGTAEAAGGNFLPYIFFFG